MGERAGGSHGFAKEFAASQRKSGVGNALISVSLTRDFVDQGVSRRPFT